MIMRRMLALTFSLGAAGWSSAHACEIDPSIIQSYGLITPSSYKSWDKSQLSVGLVYISEIQREDREVPESYFGEGQTKKPYVKVEYELIEDISGDFAPDTEHWIPAMSEAEIDRELELKNIGRGFAFWDTRDLGAVQVQGYGGSICGTPIYSSTLLPGQYYLQFKRDDKTIGMEVISNPKDSFVEDWRLIYSEAPTSKIKRAPKFYFQQISGYQDIELETCPTEEELRPISYRYGDQEKFELGPLSAVNIFRQYEFHKSEIENLKIIDLNAYQQSISKNDWRCEAGSRYLVLDKTSKEIDRGRRRFKLHYTPPKHRYLEIKNGKIDTQDILSHITILPGTDGSTEISVAQVKNWIRDAN